MSAVIYTRYSSDMQRESSTDDQIRNCKNYANRNNLQVIDTYNDQAISGSVTNRPAYQKMLADADKGLFSVLLIDDLSRLSRDEIEMKRVLKRLSYKGIRIIAVTDNYDNKAKGHKIYAGVKGLMNEIFLDDLKEKTHRGMSGQAIKGFNCGGRTYGYKNVPIEHESKKDAYGRPAVVAVRYEIDPVQSKWVSEIFNWHSEGKSYQWIASRLNELSVPSSRGKTWAISAIKVILENEMYTGQVIWNKKEWLKDPETGKRTYRNRPKEDWIIANNPELQIIPDELWNKVRGLKKRNNYGASGYRPPAQRYLFSGLMLCAECNGNFTITAKNRYGCANHKTRGKTVCTNNMTVSRAIVEGALLKELRDDLLSDEAHEIFKNELKALLQKPDLSSAANNLANELTKAEKIHANIMNAIKQGIITASTKQELEKAESQIMAIKSSIQKVESIDTSALLEKASDRFLDAIEYLGSEILADEISHARDIIRPFVGDKIIIHRRKDYLEAEIYFNMLKIIGTILDENGTERTIELDVKENLNIFPHTMEDSSISVVAGASLRLEKMGSKRRKSLKKDQMTYATLFASFDVLQKPKNRPRRKIPIVPIIKNGRTIQPRKMQLTPRVG